MNNELRDWANQVINSWDESSDLKNNKKSIVNEALSFEYLLAAIPSLPNYANTPGVHTSCAIAKTLKSLGHTTNKVEICENQENNLNSEKKINIQSEQIKSQVILIDTQAMQINELIAANNRLTIQHDKDAAKIDNAIAQQDKSHKNHLATEKELSETQKELSEFREFICESGIIECPSMSGDLPPEPEL